jgi:indole-3-glycerol phosphate synthase
MAPLIPRNVVAVAESGLTSGDDLARLHELRYDAFLVGERLVSSENAGLALERLLQRSGRRTGS